jgi:glycosyltransferase involved in cell wall biosynthesis
LQPNGNSNPTVADELSQVFAQQGWHVIATSRQSNKVLKFLDMMATCLLNRDKFDVALIDVYSTLAFIWAEAVSTLLRFLNKRFVLSLHGGNLPSLARRQTKRLKRLLQYADVVTTPSEYLQSQMAGFRNDIRLIPNPLDIRKYEFRPRDVASPSLIWLRAFHRIYNPCLVLGVVELLKEKYPEVRIFMVGPDKRDGSLGEFLREMTDRGLEECVTILGSVSKEEVPHILQRGDIFINTSNVDNAPVSVLEAMACGLCVVSTNVGGIPYMLDHEKDALLVPSGDAQAMADAVSRLLVSPVLVREISINARRKAEQKDIKRTIQMWESLFLELNGD